MKKIYIIIGGITLTISIILIVVLMLQQPNSFDKDEEIFTVKTNYTYNSSTDNYLEVILYSNNPKSYLKVYKEQRATISNESNTTVLSAMIEDVKLLTTHEYYDQTVYGYKLYIKPENFNAKFTFKNCFIQTQDFKCEIGSLAILNIEDETTYLDYSKIHAIGNEHFGFKTINAFVITFTNKSLISTTITEIDLGPYNYASLYYATVAPNDLTYSTPVEDIIGEYDPLVFDNTKGSITIPAGKSVTYVIPVFYYDVAFLGNTLIHVNNSLYIDNFNYIVNYDNLAIYEEIIIEATLYNVE